MQHNTISPRMAVVSVVIAAVLFLAVNVIANAWFSNSRADFTEGKSYTTSDQIKPIFENISEPIVVRLYYSPAVGEVSQRHALYYQRVRDLLQQYAALAKGKIKVELYTPEPFSDVEDRAVGFGLQGIPLNQGGDVGYFGLAATNSTDDQKVIPFFDLEREQFLEYDLTKLIYSLSQPNQPKVGLITGLDVNGGASPQMQMGGGNPSPPWAIMQQIKEFFTVVPLTRDITQIPKDVSMLLLIQPENLAQPTQLAIDQFVLNGGKALVFVDPHAESANPMGGMGMPAANNLDGIKKLMKAWGVSLADNEVVGDVDAAMRVNMSRDARPMISDYVAWMQVRRGNLDPNDAITGDLKQVAFGTAGALDTVEGAGTTVTPLIVTGPRSMRMDAAKFSGMPDVVGLFRDFKPSGKRETLAVRITGLSKTAFPDAPGDLLKQAKQPIQVVVVADSDFLTDRFWVEQSNFLGQQVVVPTADNGSFAINALENLTGSPALSSLRGRGVQSRPFTLVDTIRKDAEMQYRAKEQSLSSHLEELEKKVKDMQVKRDGSGAAILSDQDKKTIESYRGEILATRQELREVQRALRQSIDRLERIVTFVNIGFVPIVFGLILIVTAVVRRRRRAAAAA